MDTHAIVPDGNGAGPVIEADDSSGCEVDCIEGPRSYTTSLASAVTKYRYENGRRYHGYRDGAYFLPNDKQEQNRLELVHHIYTRLLNGQLYRAPLHESPKRVLDLGTGRGDWAIAFADQHPESEVLGTDLSPIQPSWTLPNLTFEVDDIESPWPYNASTPTFSYIHMRDLSGSISDYPSLFAQAFTHLQPSGYIELQSLEASIHSSPSSFFPFSSSSSTQCLPTALRWLSLLASAHTKSSRPLHPEAGWKSQLQAAGFIDVVEEKYSVPLTAPWSSSSSSSPPAQDENLATSGGAGELGRYMQANMHEAVEAMTLAPFTRVLGWERDEVDVLVEAVRNDLSCEQGGLWMWVWVVYGRKPA